MLKYKVYMIIKWCRLKLFPSWSVLKVSCILIGKDFFETVVNIE